MIVGNIHWWQWKIKMFEKKLDIISQAISPKIFVNYKVKTTTTVKLKQADTPYPSDQGKHQQEQDISTSGIFDMIILKRAHSLDSFLQNPQPQSSHGKYHINPSWVVCCRTINQYSLKVKSWRQGVPRGCHRLEETKKTWLSAMWGPGRDKGHWRK